MVFRPLEQWVTAYAALVCLVPPIQGGVSREWPQVYYFHCSLNAIYIIDYIGLGQLSQSSMGGFGQSLGQLNQGTGLSPALPISSASTVYQAHYGLNSLGEYTQTVEQIMKVSYVKVLRFYTPCQNDMA